MRMVISTDQVAEKERFDFWRDWVAQSFISARLERKTCAPFFGRAEINEFNHLQTVTAHSVAQRAFFERKEIARTSVPFYAVSLQLEGTSMGRQRNRDWLIEPGDIDLLDCTQPAEFGMDAECRSFMMFIPQHRLRPKLSRPDLVSGMRVPSQEIAGGMASDCLRRLVRQLDVCRPIPEAAVDITLDMLALAVGATVDARQQAEPSFREAKRQAIREYVERNLADPSLKPEKVAAATRVSLRYLHGLFAEVGESLMSLVLARRLERCREALASPAMSARTISDIALGWGFQCGSHFCRTFKAEYGMTPREWRRFASSR